MEREQATFMAELERFRKEHSLEFELPKFYGKGLNCLKLWRQVAHLGGHEQVTVCKLWRQVGETFRPPKTCTTVSWSFRIFYEKALLEYEKHKVLTGQLQIPLSAIPQPGGTNCEDKNSNPLSSRDKNTKGFGVLKRKKASSPKGAFKVSRTKVNMSQEDSMVIDVGEPADWVKINVRQTVHVQSDPAGRLVITRDLEQPKNPWGITPFKKPHTSGSAVGVENLDDTLNRIARGMFGVYVNASVSADGNHSSPLDDDLSYGLITCGSIFLLQVVHVAFFYGMTNM